MRRALPALVAVSLCVGCGRPANPAAPLFVLTMVPEGSLQPGAADSLDPDTRFPAGSRVVLAAAGAKPEDGRILSAGFSAAGSPAVSPDGQRILFAAKPTARSRWAIFETTPRGQARRLTETQMDCVDPAYLAGGRIIFSCAEPGKPWALYVASREDRAPRRMSFLPYSVSRPRPLPDGRLLARVAASPSRWELYTMNPDGTWPEKASADLAEKQEAAVPLVLSASPKGRPSEVDLTRGTGTLVCYDAKRMAARVEFFAVRDRGTRRLGGSPVEADGSFLVEVPADLPIRLRTLDSRGRAIGTSGWFWLRPGETRSCGGCHEGPTRMAENRLIRALAHDPRHLEPAP